MEYAEAKFKQLAINYAIQNGTHADCKELIKDARMIEAYLKEENSDKETA